MPSSPHVALGLDFGTESVRALIVDLDGNEHGSATAKYKHGQLINTLPGTGEKLPPDFALQHPIDWIDSSAKAVRRTMKRAALDGRAVIGIGVDFTSCTMLPALGDGTPLCMMERMTGEKYAWPKLWKHHAAKRQTDRINRIAKGRKEKWLCDYGGIIGLEWFFPKVLETLEEAPAVYDAAEVWVEGGDWYVWRLVGCDANDLPRSTCQAGYKAMWSRADGYPSRAFFKALNPKTADLVRDKMPGRLLAPGQSAGELCEKSAKKLGLRPGIPVSAATIDAHAGVPGAGVAGAGTLVMVLGTSSCHMLNATEKKYVPGVAGVVHGGILPGLYGYETGQAAVGDAFDWLRRTVGHRNFERLSREADALSPGADGVLCLDWFNGCRTPLMDGSLTGAFTGLTLNHGPHYMYRALLESSAFGLRWIVEILRESGVPVRRFVATGGLPHHNPLLVQLYADVLGQTITVPSAKQGPALGAAVLGVLAAGRNAGGFASASQAVRAMAGPRKDLPQRQPRVVKPNRGVRKAYDKIYQHYRDLVEVVRGQGPGARDQGLGGRGQGLGLGIRK